MSALRFCGIRTFDALYAAERFLKGAGFSVGSGCAGQPTAFMYGNYAVAKWKNLTGRERAGSHGVLTGDRRNGPVMLELWEACPPEGRDAFIAAASDLECLS